VPGLAVHAEGRRTPAAGRGQGGALSCAGGVHNIYKERSVGKCNRFMRAEAVAGHPLSAQLLTQAGPACGLCSQFRAQRKACAGDVQVLKSIIVALSHKEERVRAAGAACIMALSRSVKTLRCAFGSCGCL
jgi:hypothetical protein